jgi:hypothetical protein
MATRRSTSLSLSTPLRHWVDAQATSAGFPNAAANVQHLIRLEQERVRSVRVGETRREFESQLLAGLKGPGASLETAMASIRSRFVRTKAD